MCGESRVRTKSKTGKCPKTKQLRDHQRPTHISSQGQLSTTFVVVGALTLAALGCEKYEVMALLNCTNKQQSSTSDPPVRALSNQEYTLRDGWVGATVAPSTHRANIHHRHHSVRQP